ncbi:hypothetical protein FRB96_007715 [Tulasnella sp. 330]|nr:hypothetical protein FRB96_007715 [Tulasnella sp. 330]
MAGRRRGSTRNDVESKDEANKIWLAKRILAEHKTKGYKVDWEGKDPSTGKAWEPTWVPQSHCTKALIEDWKEFKKVNQEREKASKLAKQSKPAASRSTTLSATPPLEFEPTTITKSIHPKSAKRTYSNRRGGRSTSRTMKDDLHDDEEEEELPSKRRKVGVNGQTAIKTSQITSKIAKSSIGRSSPRSAPYRPSRLKAEILILNDEVLDNEVEIVNKGSTSSATTDKKKRLDPLPLPKKSRKPIVGPKSVQEAKWEQQSLGSLRDSQDVRSSPASSVSGSVKKKPIVTSRSAGGQTGLGNAIAGPSSSRSLPVVVEGGRSSPGKKRRRQKSLASDNDGETEEESAESYARRKPSKLPKRKSSSPGLVAMPSDDAVLEERSPSADRDEEEIAAALNDRASSRSVVTTDDDGKARRELSKSLSSKSTTTGHHKATHTRPRAASSREKDTFSIVLREPQTTKSTASLTQDEEDEDELSFDQSVAVQLVRRRSGQANPMTFLSRLAGTGEPSMTQGTASSPMSRSLPTKSRGGSARGSSISTSRSYSRAASGKEVYVEIPVFRSRRTASKSIEPATRERSAVSTSNLSRKSSERADVGSRRKYNQDAASSSHVASPNGERHDAHPKIFEETNAPLAFERKDEAVREVDAEVEPSSQPQEPSTSQRSNEADHSKGTIVPDSQPLQQKSSQSQPTKSEGEAQKQRQTQLQRAQSNPLNLMTAQAFDAGAVVATGNGRRRFASALPLAKSKEKVTTEHEVASLSVIEGPPSSSPSSASAISRLPNPPLPIGKPLGPVPTITPSKFRVPSNVQTDYSPSVASQIDDSPTRRPQPPPLERDMLGTPSSSKGEDSSQIQTVTTQKSEKTDFSGSRPRPRNWESVGFKDRFSEQENGKKRKPLTEWLGSAKIGAKRVEASLNNQPAYDVDTIQSLDDGVRHHMSSPTVPSAERPPSDVVLAIPSSVDHSAAVSHELLQQRDEEISGLKISLEELQVQLSSLQDKYDILDRSKAGLDTDLDFMRTQYSQASSMAAQLADQNRGLEKANKVLHSQTTVGVRQVRVTLEAEISSLRESVRRERQAKELLIEQARRSNVRLDIGADTDGEAVHVSVTGDELRQRAADWYRLRGRYATLEQEHADSIERSEKLLVLFGETSHQVDKATRRLLDIGAEKKVIEGERDHAFEEVVRLKKIVEELEDVHVCQWGVDSNNICEHEFVEVEDFNRHVRDHCSEEALPEPIPSA